MEMRRAGYSTFFVILLYASAMGSSGGKRWIPETVFSDRGKITTFLKINDKMVRWFFFSLFLNYLL